VNDKVFVYPNAFCYTNHILAYPGRLVNAGAGGYVPPPGGQKMAENLHRPTVRVLEILNLLSSAPRGLTLTQIASAISAPKSSIVPVVRAMAEKKFISRNREDGTYRIGISSFLAGNAYNKTNAALQFIRDEMQAIVSATHEICHLGVLENNEVLYIAKEDCQDPIRVISHIGKRLPVYCTALGKALICDWERRDIENAFPEGFSPFTPKTILSPDLLVNQLEAVRTLGVARDDEEVSDHLQCLAVPLWHRENIIAALSISLPSFRLTPEKENLIRTSLKVSKDRIEDHLETKGFRGTCLI